MLKSNGILAIRARRLNLVQYSRSMQNLMAYVQTPLRREIPTNQASYCRMDQSVPRPSRFDSQHTFASGIVPYPFPDIRGFSPIFKSHPYPQPYPKLTRPSPSTSPTPRPHSPLPPQTQPPYSTPSPPHTSSSPQPHRHPSPRTRPDCASQPRSPRCTLRCGRGA